MLSPIGKQQIENRMNRGEHAFAQGERENYAILNHLIKIFESNEKLISAVLEVIIDIITKIEFKLYLV